MENVLVLGGTQFFGKKLVAKLLENGKNVTIATRGLTKDPFGDKVERLIIDRENKSSLEKAFSDRKWDIVYDQTCQSPQEALDTVSALNGKSKRYIFTSTQAVYEFGTKWTEEDFIPEDFTFEYKSRKQYAGYEGYQEAKRAAETVLFTKSELDVVAVRFPIVIGADDFTERLKFHVDKVLNDEMLGIKNPKASYSFILSDEAADFLYKMGQSSFTGPINPGCEEDISLEDLISKIEERVGKSANILNDAPITNTSPYALPGSWSINTEKANRLGYQFSELHTILDELIDYYSEINKS
ncbi:NAD-dependent epimerase/dehydratase family protein [Psychrobacillus sp. NPDC058041]|uniref:NAD-dependent epimerase/dehydratase family protein n=1 Tax=Psychrobacillus sp. NPDC058041 TaxID=3346310 RepID=UPI0036D906FB